LTGVARAVTIGSLLPLLLLFWWYVSTDTTSVPPLADTLRVLAHPFEEPGIDSVSLGYSALISFLRVLIGFFLAAVTAIPLGILVARIRTVREMISPLVEMARPICPVALIPIFIAIFGSLSVGSLIYGEEAWRHDLIERLRGAMIVVIWWGAFFPIFLNTVHGVSHVKKLYLEVAKTCGAGASQLFTHVVLPASLPAIVAGLRIGMGTAWMVIVAAEFYPGTRAGLSYMITTADDVMKPEYTFASIIVIGLFGILINTMLRRIENHVGRWQAKER